MNYVNFPLALIDIKTISMLLLGVEDTRHCPLLVKVWRLSMSGLLEIVKEDYSKRLIWISGMSPMETQMLCAMNVTVLSLRSMYMFIIHIRLASLSSSSVYLSLALLLLQTRCCEHKNIYKNLPTLVSCRESVDLLFGNEETVRVQATKGSMIAEGSITSGKVSSYFVIRKGQAVITILAIY